MSSQENSATSLQSSLPSLAGAKSNVTLEENVSDDLLAQLSIQFGFCSHSLFEVPSTLSHLSEVSVFVFYLFILCLVILGI